MASSKTSRFWTIVHSINVEPVMFLYMFCIFVLFPVQQSFLYDRSCEYLFSNTTICDNLTKDESDDVQTMTSHWIMYVTIVMTFPSIITVLFFYGPVGDIYGRKLPVLIPCFGSLLSAISYIVLAFYPGVPFWYFLIGPLINGALGGFIGLMMGIYSYTSTVSDKGNRTVRIAIIEAMVFLASTAGVFVSGIILDRTSYQFAFGVVAVIMVIGILYVIFLLDNVKLVPESQDISQNCCTTVSMTLKEVFMCVKRSRPEKYKLYIIVDITILCIVMLCSTGEAEILLLYVKRPELDWSLTQYGYFRAYENVVRSVGVLLLLPLFKWRWRMKDTSLIMMGVISKMIFLVLLGVADRTWLFYFGGIFGLLQGFPSAGVRSGIAGMVEKAEQGRLFAIAASIESLATLIASLIFNSVYPETLNVYAGLPFIMAAGILAIAWLLAVWHHFDAKKVACAEFDALSEEISSSTDLTNDNVSI